MQALEHDAIRLTMTARVGGNSGTYAISTLQAFESIDGTGVNVLQGGVASASSTYNAEYDAANAFTESNSTRWASLQAVNPEWIMYEMPERKKLKSIFIKLAVNPQNAPANFIVEGRIRGESAWEKIGSFKAFATEAQFSSGVTARIQEKMISGSLKLESGSLARKVIIFDWIDGSFIGDVDNFRENGRWFFAKEKTDPELVGVVFLGPAGYRPEADGPIQWETPV